MIGSVISRARICRLELFAQPIVRLRMPELQNIACENTRRRDRSIICGNVFVIMGKIKSNVVMPMKIFLEYTKFNRLN